MRFLWWQFITTELKKKKRNKCFLFKVLTKYYTVHILCATVNVLNILQVPKALNLLFIKSCSEFASFFFDTIQLLVNSWYTQMLRHIHNQPETSLLIPCFILLTTLEMYIQDHQSVEPMCGFNRLMTNLIQTATLSVVTSDITNHFLASVLYSSFPILFKCVKHKVN